MLMLASGADGTATYAGTLTGADCKRNIAHGFEVPAGVARLRIRMSFAPLRVAGFSNLIPLSVFDPGGFRGAGHRHGSAHEVVLSADFASPGYVPREIQPGLWQVVLDTHMVMPDEPCAYRMEVDMAPPGATFAEAPKSPFSASAAPTRGPGWFRGDLHAHTVHSDARWDVPDLAAWARAQSLDFATLTDHNTVSGLSEFLSLGGPELLVMGGMELTTFWGHALMLGVHAWMDWRTRDARGMAAIAEAVMARGGTFIVAHPRAEGDPHCTGCRWVYDEVFPGPARVVEVWNTNWVSDSHNDEGLELAYDWLNAGYRMALTSGTDNHGRGEGRTYGFNNVYAESLTENAILRAIRAGHNFISAGPRLTIEARVLSGPTTEGRSKGSSLAMMGDTLPAGAGPAEIEIAWADAPAGGRLSVVADGRVWRTFDVGRDGDARVTLGPADAAWCLATLTESNGRMLALTNPIFVRAPAR